MLQMSTALPQQHNATPCTKPETMPVPDSCCAQTLQCRLSEPQYTAAASCACEHSNRPNCLMHNTLTTRNLMLMTSRTTPTAHAKCRSSPRRAELAPGQHSAMQPAGPTTHALHWPSMCHCRWRRRSVSWAKHWPSMWPQCPYSMHVSIVTTIDALLRMTNATTSRQHAAD